MVVAVLLGIGEFLRPEDLKLPVLLDQSENANRIVVDRGTVGGSAYGCDLHRYRGYEIWSEA